MNAPACRAAPQISLWGKKIPLLPVVLLIMLLIRGASLEYGDLIDPTETRYATIAQNILLLDD